MNALIKKSINKSFSARDILDMVDHKANLITYPQLLKYETIDEAMGKYGALVLLYETREYYGHWCTIFKLNKNTLEFFDPYGIIIDDELKFINKKFRQESNQDFPYLTKLLYNSKYKITYNHHQFQKYGHNINTCGRWVSLRLIFRKLSLKQFIKLFDLKGINNDWLVTALTLYE